jgi:hypothetical protein
MDYVSLDLETTCLAPKEPANIIGISMVYEDSKKDIDLYQLNHFTCLIARPLWKGSTYALGMNGWLLDMIAGRTQSQFNIMDHTAWIPAANDWLHSIRAQFNNNKRLTLGGKNAASFDLQFLPPILQGHFRHRVYDPGSRCMNWDEDVLPELSQLKERAGLPSEVSHNMYEDALDVIRVSRHDRDNPKKPK